LDAPSVVNPSPSGSFGSLNALPHPRYHSTLAPLYQKSSSPSRGLSTSVPTSGGNGRALTSRFPKSHRTAASVLPRSINLRTAGELRRGSTAGLNVVSQRPPLPPKIEQRSHSYDGLLDDDASMRGSAKRNRRLGGRTTTEGQDMADGSGGISSAAAAAAAADSGNTGTSLKAKLATTAMIRKRDDDHANRKSFKQDVPGLVEAGTSTGETIKSKNRRSRSMDDLFDDDGVAGFDFLDNTQSMETLLAANEEELTARDSEPEASCSSPEPPSSPIRTLGGGNICFNRRFVHDDEQLATTSETDQGEEEEEELPQEPLCEKETITVDSTPRYETEEDGDQVSTRSSLTSHASTASGATSPTVDGDGKESKKPPKPLMQRYVKKVKSLMKM
ncbi:uncharacterized protein LOC125955577, partial [Anopheles darlingi]|uniref:uncharacterized protein LOC125955577 n=1 Tax=Anopheles darlingi TaxID=43151 RepID=UPI0021006531